LGGDKTNSKGTDRSRTGVPSGLATSRSGHGLSKKCQKRQPISIGAPDRFSAGAGSVGTSATPFAYIFPDFLEVLTPLRMIVHISSLLAEPKAGRRRTHNRLAGNHLTVSMKITILVFSSLLGTCVFAAKIGDSYDQVLVEKGKTRIRGSDLSVRKFRGRLLTYARCQHPVCGTMSSL